MVQREREHSAILSNFIKLPFVVKIGFLSIFEWPLKSGFTVTKIPILATSSCTHMRICVHVGTTLVTTRAFFRI